MLIITMGACQHFFFDEKKLLENAVWPYDRILEFEFQIDDSSKVYNIYLEAVHSNEYPNQNVYSKVTVTFPDGKTREQQVSFELADSKGEWLGNCSGKTCSRRMHFMPNAVFDETGKYKMKFEQYTRSEKVEGIHSLRLIIEKTDEQRTAKEKNKSSNKQNN